MSNKSSFFSIVISIIAIVISAYCLLTTLPVDESYKKMEEYSTFNMKDYDMTKTEIETLVKDNIEIINSGIKDGKLTELLQINGIESIIIRDGKIAFYCGKTKMGNKEGFHGFAYNLSDSAISYNEDAPNVSIVKTDGEKELTGSEVTVNGKTHQMETIYRTEDIIEDIFYFETQVYGL